MSRRTLLFITLFLLPNLACSLIGGPPSIVIPTPIATAPPLAAQPVGTLIFDPVSDVVPKIDPAIEALMNQVSQQNLVGYVQTLEGFGTRHSLSLTDRADWGVGAARLMIYNEMIRVGNGRLQVTFDDFPMTVNGISSNQQNVVGILPGTAPNPSILVLSAHYDSRTADPLDGESRAPGANDNASGVAVVLELARLFSSRSWNQTIVFVAFAGEEQGRNGSEHFVTDRFLQGWVMNGVLNNDIVGGRPGISQSLRIFSPGPDTNPSRQFARYLEFVGGLYLPTFAITLEDAIDREGRYSDHISFQNAGIPALRLTESQEDANRQHNGRDTSEALDYNYLTQVAKLNFVTLANAAGAPPTPPVPQMAAMSDPGSFILTWPVDPLAAGYVISFRPIGTAGYAPFHYVTANQAGNVAITGLDASSSYAVSLAAVDANGLISLFSPEVAAPFSP